MAEPTRPIKIFYSYAREDQPHVNALERQLVSLKRSGQIETFHTGMVLAGQDLGEAITTALNNADIILLMVSPDFMASDYIYEREVPRAVERAARGEARVIPVILRNTIWHDAPFSIFQSLPTNARPVVSWADRDAAYANIAEGIRDVVIELQKEQVVQVDWVAEGERLMELAQFEQALGAYEQAIKLNTDNTVAYVGKGEALRELGQSTEALRAYEQAIRLEPTNADWHIRRGNILSDLGRFADALKAYNQALFLAHDHYLAHLEKGHALYNLAQQEKDSIDNKQRRYEEALEAYDLALRLAPQNGARPRQIASIYRSKGKALHALHRDDEALAVDKQAEGLAPNAPATSLLTGGMDVAGGIAGHFNLHEVDREVKTPQARTNLDSPGIAIQLLSRTFPTAYWHVLTKEAFPLVMVEIDNSATGAARSRFTIEAVIQGFSELAIETRTIQSGSREWISLLPRLSNEKMINLTEIRTASCRIRVKQHGKNGPVEIYDNTYDLQLQALNTALLAIVDNEGNLAKDLANYLAVFVTPNKPEIQAFMGIAAAEHPDKALDGYQANGEMSIQQKRAIVREQAKAIFMALKKYVKPLYVFSAMSFGGSPGQLTQRVRLPAQSLSHEKGQAGQAYCLDGALLFASLLENIGLEPVIVLIPGHAFVGWRIWRGSNEYDFLETTMIRDSSFNDALAEGNRLYREARERGDDKRSFLDANGFMRMIDIAASRKEGVYPLQ